MAVPSTIFDQILAYANTKGEKQHTPVRLVLGHFFNHQTHHRGQVSTLLTQCNIDIGITDLPMLPLLLSD